MPATEVYRDADTLLRFLRMIDADQSSLAAVEATMVDALAMMAGEPATKMVAADVTQNRGQSNPAPALSSFRVGDLVALRSNPSIYLPVLEVITGGAECRYRVFQNNTKATYYESQLQAISAKADERERIAVHALHAYLTGLQILSPSTANLFSLRSGRVKFVPYQYRPVLKLIRADRPRLLIADEVGARGDRIADPGVMELEVRAGDREAKTTRFRANLLILLHFQSPVHNLETTLHYHDFTCQ
jgi:ATP-dependent helicase HepA